MPLQGLPEGSRVKGVEEARWPLQNTILDSFLLSEDEASHRPSKVSLVTCAGGQLSPCLRNSILFHPVLAISTSPSSLALSSQHASYSHVRALQLKPKIPPSILSCFLGTSSVLSFPSPVALHITPKCFLPFYSIHSVHPHLLPLTHSQNSQAHFSPYQVRWLLWLLCTAGH